ncbi:Copine-domain-containing protein [Piromyces finnis]|uniref:Copine-domain-containing protein n=1 Tax=Piromyces finnis TaxID=1754191 RepID=A0A1Y1V2V5_9FUNG|nr:Copine-domain-containing protein [Piromyces finnis]|eukprot:ORX45376.1 Copine-domain-containing protein [Piromyces finnis]
MASFSLTGAPICEEPESIEFTNNYSNYEGISYAPNAKVEIKLSCDSLPKTDPKVFVFFEEKVYTKGIPESKWILVGSTETVKNDQNPSFSKSFIFEYYFQYIQNLRFVVLGMGGKNEGFLTNDYIGYVEKTIGELLVNAKQNKCTYDLNYSIPFGMKFKEGRNSAKDARITINIEEVANTACQAYFKISCKNLDKKDLLGKSDPYFVISKQLESGDWTKVYTSKVKKFTLNPVWKNIIIDIVKFNSGNDKKLLRFEVFDWDRNTDPDYIGKFEADFETIKIKKTFEIINEKKREKKNNYRNSGIMTFEKIEIGEGFSFSTFPLHGTEIAVVFAIDFTSSNGTPHEEDSLHKIVDLSDLSDYNSLNHYQKAITSIGQVLEVYDSNKEFGVYGYGAQFGDDDTMNFEYPLTGDDKNPNVNGIQGVLNAYYKTLENCRLGFPTNFAPIINKITRMVKNTGVEKIKNELVLKQYTILTIITDGDISDMKETIVAIREASEYPISIIIVGVGDNDFSNMEQLDGDNIQISGQGKKIRDIVQFVPLNKYIDNPQLLASETLAEVPLQFFEYVSENKCVPPDFNE